MDVNSNSGCAYQLIFILRSLHLQAGRKVIANLCCCCRDQWLDCARVAFSSVDAAEKGHISSGQLVNLISSKLPAEEVEHAVEQALMEAGCAGEVLHAFLHSTMFIQAGTGIVLFAPACMTTEQME